MKALTEITLELFGDYINFVCAFPVSPEKALAPYLDSSVGEQQTVGPRKVSTRLIGFSVLGVGVAMIIARIGAAIGMAPDSSWVSQQLDRSDQLLLPAAGVILILILALVSHLVLRVTSYVGQKALQMPPLLGTVPDTVNATLAFACWYIPLMTIALVAVRIAAARGSVHPLVFAAIALPVALAFWAYFTAAMAATHRMTIGQAGSILGFTIGILTIVASQFN